MNEAHRNECPIDRHREQAENATLQAATAPLLARIAELERSLARARKVRRRAVATLYKRALDAEALLAEGAQAVRWSPFSAYWSNELRRIFGPEARAGIDALEARLREAQYAARETKESNQ